MLRIIGYYEVTGGFLGLMLCILGLYSINPSDSLVTVIYIFAILAYLYTMFSGVLIIRNPNKPVSIFHSITCQFLQLAHISIPAFTYKFVSGLAVFIGLEKQTEIQLGFKVTLSTFLIEWDLGIDDFFIGLNLVPFALLIFLVRKYIVSSTSIGITND